MKKCFGFSVLLLLLGGCSSAQNKDPAAARIVTEDIARFWQAYDQAAPGFPAEPFQKLYLDPGSKGLKSFMAERIESAENLAATIRDFPNYYKAIRQETLRVQEIEPKIRKTFFKLAELYPEAVFPDTFFVIGALNSGGTASKNSLIIGTEIFSVSEETPLSELNAWLKSVVSSAESLPFIVAHELIHFQQSYRKGDLLHQAIMEGSADFLAELISGQNSNEQMHAYADSREKTLWLEFERVMHEDDVSDWLYNGGEFQNRPADLGYWMGYKISKTYYDKAVDKKQAVADIIRVDDADEFLEKSGYADKFR